MKYLIRLVYASRSTSAPGVQYQGLDPGVARILGKSRKNNASQQIVGGLLFGHGCFLQCLEGDADAVDELYRKIALDQRHRDVTVLGRQVITQRSFGAWSMKYVPGEGALKQRLAGWGMSRFDPYRLSAKSLDEAISLMQQEADAAVTLPAELDSPQAEPVLRRLNPTPSSASGKGGSPRASTSPPASRLGVALAALFTFVATAGLAGYWLTR